MKCFMIFVVLVCKYACAVGHGVNSTQDGVLTFLVLGDWGGQTIWPFTTKGEVDCAQRMGIIAKEINSSFVLALGDNFYSFGIQTDVHDKRFKETFEDVFTAPSLQTPWYVVGGNHDWRGNISAEVEYSKISQRWNFPSLYYVLKRTIPGTKTTVAFVMVDTVVLCGLLDEFSTEEELKGPLDKMAAEVHWLWLEKQLQQTMDAEYVIVAGHYPVWSIAEHGPTQCLVDRLRPLLIKYKVNAYFSGHDHNLQHLREDNSTVEYFVSGAGHLINNSLAHKGSVPPNALKYHFSDTASMGGFAYLQATPTNMMLVFADGLTGRDLYKAVIRPRLAPGN